jgi:signal transduction histidine kinase
VIINSNIILITLSILLIIIFILTKELILNNLINNSSNKGLVLLRKTNEDFIIIRFNQLANKYMLSFSNKFKKKGLFSVLNSSLNIRTFNMQNFEDKLAVSKITSTPHSIDEISLFDSASSLNIFLKIELMYFNKLFPKYSILLIEDITSLKTELNKQLQLAQLTSLTNIFSSISHNLNSSILNISNSSKSLNSLTTEYENSISNPIVTKEDHLDISSEMFTSINNIQDSAATMSSVIGKIKKQLTTVTHNYTIGFSIKELIHKIDLLFNFEYSKLNINLSKDIQISNDIVLDYEIESLFEVLKNIFKNSVESYSCKNISKEIKFSAYTSDDLKNIVLEVEDNGCGIPINIRNNIFNKMTTTKGRFGNGISLYFSKLTIESKYDGAIWFNTLEGVGTTFYISIPINLSYYRSKSSIHNMAELDNHQLTDIGDFKNIS